MAVSPRPHAMDGSGPPSRLLNQNRLSQQVLARLTELILTGQFQPGDYLPREEDLCGQFGVSRTAVREAMRVLEARRLVVPKPGVGTIVTGRFDQQLADSFALSIRGEQVRPDELVEFRRLIEGHAAYLAATRATPEEIAALQDALSRMAPDTGGGRADPVEADVEFHVILAEASHNTLLTIVIRAIRDVIRGSIRRTLPAQTDMQSRLEYHRRIVDAIAAQDPEAAMAAVHTQMQDTARLLRETQTRGS